MIDLNGGANYDSLYNDSLVGYTLSYTWGNSSHSLIYSGSPGSDFTLKNENNTIANCALMAGSIGIYYTGYTNSTWLEGGQVFANNSFINQNAYGMYLYFQNAPNIINNTIVTNSTTNSFYGMYMYYVQNGANILKNKISGLAGGYGIALYYSAGGSSASNLFANNFIQVGDPTTSNQSYGFYIQNSPNQNIYYNSVNITSGSSLASANTYGFYANYGSSSQNINIKDNVFANPGDGSSNAGNAIYLSDPTLVASDYNDLWSSSFGAVGYLGSTSTTYTNLAAWQTASALDSHSVSVNPQYTSSSDLHSKAAGINNKAIPLSAVSDDIDGQTRSTTTPDMGADEFTPPISLDASVSSVDTPVANFCVGSNPVAVTITNNGSITISNVIVNWTVNGTAQTSVSWSGTLNSGMSAHVSLGNYTFSKGGYKIVAWTSKPNGAKDSNTTNDTATKANLHDGFSGTFTIDGNASTSGTTYQTFTDAVNDLLLHGVCGAVTYNVKDNYYNEQIIINKVPGASATNNITFQSSSGHSAQVVLDFASSWSSTGNYALDLRGASWLTFKKLTFSRSGSSYYANVIVVEKGASNNSFIQDSIIGTTYSSTASISSLVYSPTDVDSNNLFQGNIMKYGSMGFYYLGSGSSSLESKTVIKDNLIDSCYYMGIYMGNQHSPTIYNNTISNMGYTYGSYGIYFSGSIYEHTICEKNKIYIPNSGYGIFMNYGSIISLYGDTAIFANNFISVGSATYASYGIYAYCASNNTTNCYIDYNSINITGSNSSSMGMWLYSYSSSFTVYNNNIINKVGGYAIYFASSSSTVSDMDYNDLYTSGTYIGYYGGSTAKALSDWQSTTSLDANSISVDPKYSSVQDLHASNVALKAGTPLSYILDDIDGDKRSTKTPIIGADEFSTVTNDISLFAILNPVGGICGNTKTSITVVAKNIGSNSQSSVPVNVSVNGGTVLTATGTKTLSTGMSDTITFSSTVSTVAGGSFSIKAWTSLSTDADHTNDTLTSVVAINALPTASFMAKNACIGNAVNFTDASKNAKTWSYKFGDGGSSSSSSPSYSYTKTGTYTVTQIAYNGTCVDSIKRNITINPKPLAKFGITSLCKDTIQFADSSSIASGNITNWSWKYGDGNSGSIQNPSHYFSKLGITTVVLTVKSDSGCIDSTSRIYSIDRMPHGKFSTTPLSGRMYQFKSFDTTGTFTYGWDFGDTSTASTKAPSHNYLKDGFKTVTLSIKNSNGCMAMGMDTFSIHLTGIIAFDQNGIGQVRIYPNPFMDAMHVNYTLSQAAHIRIEICDLTGRTIGLLSDNQQSEGTHTISLNAKEYNMNQAGIYILKLMVGDRENTYKLIKMR